MIRCEAGLNNMNPTTWRNVRVFVSSTFRDMQAERDYLVKVVFPGLGREVRSDSSCPC